MIAKLKCIFLVTSLNSGGIENYLLRFLTYYKAEIDATVLCKSGVLGQLESAYRSIGCEIVPMQLLYTNFSNYRQFYSYVKNEQFDAVVDFTGNYAALPLWMARLAGIPRRIAFYRGSTRHFKEDFFRVTYDKLMNAIVPKVATKILSNSVAALEYFYKDRYQGQPMFQVIYNGIPIDQFNLHTNHLRQELSIPDDAVVIAHIGRYNSAKNHPTIFRVISELMYKHRHLHFIGAGQDVEPGLIVDWPIDHQQRMHLLGYRSDVKTILNTCDIFFFPSLSEGQPNALIEAMVSDKPVVASNIEPIKESVQEDFRTKLIPPLDEKVFVDVLNQLIVHPEKRMSYNLCQWATQQFDHHKQFREFFEVLCQ